MGGMGAADIFPRQANMSVSLAHTAIRIFHLFPSRPITALNTRRVSLTNTGLYPKLYSKVVDFEANPLEKIFWRVLGSNFGSGERWQRSFPVGGHVRHKFARIVHWCASCKNTTLESLTPKF